MGVAVVVSGTPGTGKSRVALELVRRLNGLYLNLSEIALLNNFIVEKDLKRDSYIVDEEKLKAYLVNVIKSYSGYVIVDSHYGEIVPDEYVEKIFVLRLHPRELYLRLKQRGWDEFKVKENVEAELLSICTYNALEEHPTSKVCEVNVTGRDVDDIVHEIVEVLNGRKPCYLGIDWLSDDVLTEIQQL